VTIDPADCSINSDLTLPSGQRASSVWHLLSRSAWLIGLLIPGVLLHGAWRLTSTPSPWPRWFLRHAARACGACVEQIGTPLRRDVVFVANHVSWIDILVIGGIVDVRFISQDKVRHWPVIGWLAVFDATIFVSRTDRVGVAAQIARVSAAVAGDRPIAIFPEGTTTDGRSLLPFKPALFAALEPPPRPLMIQPVVLEFDDRGSALAWIGTEHGAANALRLLRRPGKFVIGVRFLDAFDSAAAGDRKAIAGEARRRIAAALSARYDRAVA